MEKVHDLLRGDKIGQTQNCVKKGWIDREIKYGDSIGRTRLDLNSTRNRCPKSSAKIRNENFRSKFSIKIFILNFRPKFMTKFSVENFDPKFRPKFLIKILVWIFGQSFRSNFSSIFEFFVFSSKMTFLERSILKRTFHH